MIDLSAIRRRARALLACALVLAAAACSAGRGSRGPAGVVTVPELVAMARRGTTASAMYAEIERSGTVYRLTPEQSERMRTAGVPAALLGDLELNYEHAVRTNPALETSDTHWHEVDGYWYGGTPYGWPRAWVVGAPPLGAPLRGGH